MVEVYSIKNWFKCFAFFIFVSFMVASVFPNTKIVKVVSGDFYPPFIWVDDEGNPQGFSVDFFKLLKEKTKLNFELKPMRFSDALQQIKTGKADMINFIFKTPEREKYMLFSNPILEVKSNVYYRKELNLKNLSDLGPYVIAAIKGDANVSLVLKNYPQLNFKFYDNFSNLMEAVKNRKVNVFIMEDFTAHYYLVKADLTTAFRKLNISKQNLYLGISKDRTDLLKIINDAIDSSRDEINNFVELYYYEESFFKAHKWLVMMIITVLAITAIAFYVVLIINRYLKNEVKKRTRDLQLKNEELQAAHEEISAMNQELTASNEELEGAYREVSNYQNQLDQILDLISKIAERNVNEETYFKESSKFLFEHIPAFEFSMVINLINDGKHESLDATILSKDNDFKKFTLRKSPQRMREHLINNDNKILRIEDF
ncbi:MAG: transporter substrate-binding domain-containing protein, partial [Thermotogae bacterium]|nr:transporter substrate-binding domain-containing protein [Thermotogota bacterium]